MSKRSRPPLQRLWAEAGTDTVCDLHSCTLQESALLFGLHGPSSAPGGIH